LRGTTQRTTAGVLERMQGDIAAVLTPEQKAKFETQVSQARERIRHFLEERARRIKAREKRDPPPPK